MKKFIVSFLILAVFAGVLLFIGWTQFSIPSGTVGVLISKTGGIHSSAIVPGEFTWRWERLIPTNSQIRSFSMYPVALSKTISGSLPSADIYSPMLEGKPDFSYSLTTAVEIQLKQSALPSFVRRTNALSQDDILVYLDATALEITQDTFDYILEQNTLKKTDQISIQYDTEALIQHLQNLAKYADIQIDAVVIKNIVLPDAALYSTAKEAYLTYQDKVKGALSELSAEQSAESAQDYLQIERFSRWGKVLEEYPILIELIAVSKDDAGNALSILKSITKP